MNTYTISPCLELYFFLQVRIDIPESWLGREVHLRWKAGCESMIWTSDGIPLQGLSGN